MADDAPKLTDPAVAQAKPKPGPRQAALGCGIMFILVCLVIGVVAGIMGKHGHGEDGSPAPPEVARVPADTAGLRIAVSLDQLTAAMPLLAQLPMTTKRQDGGIQYGWANVSLRGSSNSVSAFDDGGDGTLDSMVVAATLEEANNDTVAEGLILLSRVVAVTGKPPESIDQIQKWIVANFRREKSAHRFGSVLVKLGFIPAKGGGLIFMTVNEPGAR